MRPAAFPRATPRLHDMTAPNLNWIADYICGIADDMLRDVYVRGKYRNVILPRTVLWRARRGAGAHQAVVLGMTASLDAAGIANQDTAPGRRPGGASTAP